MGALTPAPLTPPPRLAIDRKDRDERLFECRQ